MNGHPSAAAAVILFGYLVSLCKDVSVAMEITSSGPQTLQMAQGDAVTLGCTYSPGPLDTGELDIEWSIVSPDTTQKDQPVISYTSGRKYIHGNPDLMKGLDFAAGNPSNGDASLSISSVSGGHSGVYQCKVKKSPGVDTRKLSLVVMERPSPPKCSVEGGEAVGRPVTLRCRSLQGSTPMSYQWKREIGGPTPPEATEDTLTGELKISNHSEAFTGIYTCEVSNSVGKGRCKINLRALKPPNKAGVVAGTVVGVLLLVIIIAIVIWLLVFRRQPRFEKEVSNDIREDVPPPESRPASRMSSRNRGVGYSPVEGASQFPSSSSTSYSANKYEYDSRFGYAV
ncbi:V-set and immunoglobulin domain-containing protein 8a [Engraulis encrasicolus]|uniref:V-set and immunoglobulin domain-containing protein 8a n=1 Tax=Engraulis encrasicolus TaxID=184585 RepID=UPI002FD2F2FE